MDTHVGIGLNVEDLQWQKRGNRNDSSAIYAGEVEGRWRTVRMG